MQKVRVGDLEMAYELMGEGPPLVLIMGLTASMDWWSPELLEDLARHFRVLVFDNRGAGRTGAPPGEITVEQMAADTIGLMDALGIDRAHIMGMSMGGMIAQQLALDFPGRVDRLVLCVTYPGGKSAVLAEPEVVKLLADRSGTPDEQVRRFLGLLFSEEWLAENVDYFDDFLERYKAAPATDENALRQFMATARFDVYDRLDEIEAPTLVVGGAHDRLLPFANSAMIAERTPGARLVEFEDAGHGCIFQCMDDFLEELYGFLG